MEVPTKDTLTECLVIRVSPEMKADLETIANKSIAPKVSEHVRYALEKYISFALKESDDWAVLS